MHLMSPQGSHVDGVSDSTNRHCQSRSEYVLAISEYPYSKGMTHVDGSSYETSNAEASIEDRVGNSV
jgi:hypothetical protein